MYTPIAIIPNTKTRIESQMTTPAQHRRNTKYKIPRTKAATTAPMRTRYALWMSVRDWVMSAADT
mgnify:CR=1 FL=1